MTANVIFSFALGMALLFWGMRLLKMGLENAAGARFKAALKRMTTTPVNGMITGTIITALIQSSTAVTVFSISLVNAGLLSFEQTLGIILGSNIGSTITAQLMAFDLGALALPLIALGGSLFLLGKNSLRWIGLGVLGFGMVFLGIGDISKSLRPLGNSPGFMNLLNHLGDNHLLGIFAGVALAGLVHSSGVTTAMVIVLASQNLITLPTAIAIVLGANVGTCVTAILAAIGGDTGAKRVAVSHLLLNVIGVAAIYPFLHLFASAISWIATDLGRQVAHAHTLFNVGSSVLALPVIKPFAKLVCYLVPDNEIKSI